MAVRDTRVIRRLTKQLTQSEERTSHLRRLFKKGIGFRTEEEFLAREKSKLRGKTFNSKKKDKILSLVMEEKIKDNVKFELKVRKMKNKARRELEEDLGP